MTGLIRQHIKDTYKALRHGYPRPALWETRQWLQLVTREVPAGPGSSDEGRAAARAIWQDSRKKAEGE